MKTCLWLQVSFISWAHVVLSLSLFPARPGRPRLIFPERVGHVNRLNHGELQMGDATAKLSNWIYEPYERPLPVGLQLDPEHVHMVSTTSAIQWAVLTSDETVYVVFRGTAGTEDIFTDLNLFPVRVLSDKLNIVHGGIWNALHFADNEATDEIKIILKAAIADNPKIEVVVCGHSLGGAYAILCALELIHEDDPVKVDHVISHGPPQLRDTELLCYVCQLTIV